MVTNVEGEKKLTKDPEKVVEYLAMTMGSPRLSDLIHRLVKDSGFTFEEAAKTVYLLWKKDRVDLTRTRQCLSLRKYILSLESLRFWAITALITLTVLIAFLQANAPLLYVRYVLGSIFVLYMPGSMLIEALYPKSGDLENVERLALSIGLSLAIVPFIGLLLNYSPWGIELAPITISLALFTEATASIALVRKHQYHILSLGK